MATLFENLTLNPGNIQSLREAVIETFYQTESLDKYTHLVKAKSGDPIALIGALEDVGKAGAGCDPEYESKGIANQLKRWKLGEWSIPIKICYKSLEGTFAQLGLKGGTEIGDLTDTDVLAIYTDALNRAIVEMFWRFGWFGSLKAKTIADGGVVTNGTDLAKINVCDGLWQRIYTQVAANAAQLTKIEANAQKTYAAQKEAALAEGYATGILDTLMMEADSRISGNSNAVVFVTKALADALTVDIKNWYKYSLPWEVVFDGFKTTSYNGVTIVAVSIWDRIIKSYENTGTALNKPYRAVYVDPKQLLVATDADGLFTDLDIFFDHKSRNQYIYAAGKIDTNLLEDGLFQVAY